MISTEIRRSQTYVGTGDVNSYTFPFRVFAAGQVKVYVRAADAASGTLLDTTQYSVTLASASAQTVGGTVTLSSPLAAGAKLVILSNIPYTQLLALQNQGAFNAEDLNGAWDKNTALIQQVLDTLNRAVLAPELGDDTPEAFTLSLFEARDTAVEKAGEAANSASASAASASDAAASASAAASSAAEAEASKDAINVTKEQVTAEGQKQIAAIQTEGGTQISNVQSVGDAQASHISTVGSDVVASIKLYGQDEVDRITQTGGTWNDTVVATGQKWKQDVIAAGSDSLAKATAQATAAEASANKASGFADAASAAAKAAETSENVAVSSATAAGVSEANAKTSETAAASSKTAAASSASAASQSAAAAGTSATEAGSRATAAAASASAAKALQDAAAASATAAKSSETKAATAESNASASKTAAATSASTASTKAEAAATSATAAAGSAAAAKSSETKAATSESNAASSATAASSSAAAAKSSETKAATSESNASASKTAAAASATAAKASEDKAAEYANQASSGQIQADWTETDTAAKGYIKNKPVQLTSEAVGTGTATAQGTISAAQLKTAIKAVAPAEYTVLKAELETGEAVKFGTVTAAGVKAAILKWAPAQDLSGYLLKTDFTWAGISGKPTIPAAQVQTDWNATTGMGALLNKPAQMTDAAAEAGTATGGCIISAATLKAAITTHAPAPDLSGYVTTVNFTWANLGGKPTIPAAQVNSDWSATSGVAQILNKPTFGALASKDKVGSADIAAGAIPADATAAAILAAFTQFATKNGIT